MIKNAVPRFISASVLVVLVVLVAKLAIAPVHGVHDAAGCEQAWADARSRTDTISADLLSFPDSLNRRISRRCGELRTP
jgi:hypothetical protein